MTMLFYNINSRFFFIFRKENVPMSKKCSNCGFDMADDAVFCTATRPQNEPPQNQTSDQNTQQNAQPQNQYSAPYNQQYAQPQPNYYSQSPEDYAQNAVVTTGAFFGLNLLFSLPAIGWIICLIMSFAPKNKNIKNFARSKLIWIIIAIILGAICGIIFASVFKNMGVDIDDYFSSYTI